MNDPAELVPPNLAGRRPNLLRLWFGVSTPVGPWAYALSGLGLSAFKYAVEAGAVWVFAGVRMTPLDFVNPLISERQSWLGAFGPLWATIGVWIWLLWTLPFLWIALSMSIRRAADAGSSPWLGLLVLVPLMNLLVMASLSLLPRRPLAHLDYDDFKQEQSRALSAAVSIAVSVMVGALTFAVSIYSLSSYGGTLFIGTPLVMGATAAYLDSRSQRRSWESAVGIGLVSVSAAAVALLLFALEGVICIAMALPLIWPLGAMGGALGKLMADAAGKRRHDWIAAGLLLPILAGGESWLLTPHERVVETRIEIDAPPETVWNHVIAFPDLPQERAWFFRLGIACPERARIEGSGPGAVRHCEFSTGDFVEPITLWQPPQRLAFDVTEQPEPMFELSPYRHVHPPHLAGSLRSHRGEFLLVALPGGRTRLEGRTWYSVDIHPQFYWQAISDRLIGAIHQRVLEHIKHLAEAPVGQAGAIGGRSELNAVCVRSDLRTPADKHD